MLQALENVFQHCLALLQHFIVPVAHHPVALGFEVLGATLVVVLLILMLGAVEFNDDFSIFAEKVDDVVADGDLAAEFVAVQLASA